MKMKNDVLFLFNFQVNLYEHQSTVKPNMPLRDLFYVADFLKRNRAEAIKVSIYEYNEELHLATVRSEGYEDGLSDGLERGISQGIAQGITRSILELLEELGTVPENVQEMIERQNDLAKLSEWHKLAAKSESLDIFIHNMKM